MSRTSNVIGLGFRKIAVMALDGAYPGSLTGVVDVVQNLNLLRAFGIEPDESRAPRFELHEADRSAANDLLSAVGVERRAELDGTTRGIVGRIGLCARGRHDEPVLSESDRDVTVTIGPEHAHAVVGKFGEHARDGMAIAVRPHAHDSDPRVHGSEELAEVGRAPMMRHLENVRGKPIADDRLVLHHRLLFFLSVSGAKQRH